MTPDHLTITGSLRRGSLTPVGAIRLHCRRYGPASLHDLVEMLIAGGAATRHVEAASLVAEAVEGGAVRLAQGARYVATKEEVTP